MTTDRFAASRALHAAARERIPGGVTSSVRGPAVPLPLYFDRGKGSRLWDVDGNEYIDFVLAYGPSILGHAPDQLIAALSEQAARGLTFGAQHALEVRAAELITQAVPGAEQVIFSNTGSEAVSAALRIARAATGRPKVLKFQGHYHGWLDGVFASVGNAALPNQPEPPIPVAQTLGMSPGALTDLLVCPWNSLEETERLVRENAHDLAAIIVEPVNVNAGVIPPQPGTLEALRALANEVGALLVFDEIITGFRLALGGAQEYYKVRADLAIFAKALAGGYPVSAVTGSRDLLDIIASGRLAHNGTFNGNPMGCAAVVATLSALMLDPAATYARLHRLGDRLSAGLASLSDDLTVRSVGPICFSIFGEPRGVVRIQDRRGADAKKQAAFATGLIQGGIHTQGLWYISTAHTDADIDTALAVAERVIGDLAG